MLRQYQNIDIKLSNGRKAVEQSNSNVEISTFDKISVLLDPNEAQNEYGFAEEKGCQPRIISRNQSSKAHLTNRPEIEIARVVSEYIT